MHIAINGAVREVEFNCTVEELIDQLGLNPAGVAVAVNQTVVPRSSRTVHALQPQDRVEIIQAVGGG